MKGAKKVTQEKVRLGEEPLLPGDSQDSSGVYSGLTLAGHLGNPHNPPEEPQEGLVEGTTQSFIKF